MRSETTRAKLEQFMKDLGTHVRSHGRVYLTGGGTALLHGWRDTTIDIDIKAAPEPDGFFEAIAQLKETADLNVELASPEQFIPELHGWEDRSLWIARHGAIDFFHYDLYSQALAKIERGHRRDLADVQAMIERRLIAPDRLWGYFLQIEPALIRYPAIEPAAFRTAAWSVCQPYIEP